MVKTSNVRKLAFFIFSESFSESARILLDKVCFSSYNSKCDLIIDSRYIIGKRVTGMIKSQC